MKIFNVKSGPGSKIFFIKSHFQCLQNSFDLVGLIPGLMPPMKWSKRSLAFVLLLSASRGTRTDDVTCFVKIVSLFHSGVTYVIRSQSSLVQGDKG